MGVLMHRQGMPIGYIAITLALVASMGGFIFGYDTGQISDILLMEDFRLRFSGCPADSTIETCDFSRVRSGAIVGLLSIGTLVGALLGAPTADYFGRRRAMIIQCTIFMLGVVIQITAFNSWAQFAIGRLVSGVGVGGLSAAVPTYQAETAPSQIRGSLTATYQLFITLGILVAYAISIGTRSMGGSGSWRTVVGIGLIWPLILIGGMLFMPESPRWLAKQGRIEHARESLARVRGIKKHDAHEHRIVRSEADGIQSQVEYERNVKAGWAACFKPKDKILYRTLLGMTLQMLQQLTGANYFFYYGATIFKSVGIQDSFVTQLILGAVNFISTFGGIYVMERFGRRWPLIIGGLWQSAWLFVFAAVGTAHDPAEDPDSPQSKTTGTVMIVSACLFIFGYAMTWAPGVWIIIGETFPTRTRAKQASLATASNWLWNFLLAFFTPFIVGDIKYAYGFIFAGCNLAGAIIVFFFLYESSDLSLEAVDMMYNDPHTKAWTSARWAPEGYHSRQDLISQAKAAEMQKPREEGGHVHGGKEERFENAAHGAGMKDAEKGHGMQPPRAPGMREEAQRPYSEDGTVVNDA